MYRVVERCLKRVYELSLVYKITNGISTGFIIFIARDTMFYSLPTPGSNSATRLQLYYIEGSNESVAISVI